MRLRRALPLVLILTTAACAREAPRFSLENARVHVQMLAGTIGSRPIGTPENARARQYVVDQLRLFGYDVRVQETDARRPDLGYTARVANVIAMKPGADRNAIAVVSHYDSSSEAPGAADDGLGVAVSLEAARVLAAKTDRRHTLMILVTDGEESGLMGAAGLVTDRDVMSRLNAYINVEATGSSGHAVLFETGPGNGWIVKPWARSAPQPRGASFAIEIYKRLPNDTDFSIFKRHDVPGLNFASIGDSYSYHTARDTPERLSDATLATTGENVVQTVMALDGMDLRTRTTADQTYFDIGRTVAVSWGPVTAWFIAAISLVCGLLAWFKTLGACVRLIGIWKWIMEAAWSLLGVTVVAGSMVGATWLLRHGRTVYHPWYAYPDRFFLMLLAIGLLAGWLVVRIGALLPARAHPARHPMLVWSLTLPVWIVLAGVTASLAPTAGYLWTVPLLVAALGLLAAPVASAPLVRAVSVLVLGVAGSLWLFDTIDLMRFMVALFGRLPIITPVWIYAAVMLACGAMVIPPFIAMVAATKPLPRPALVTAAMLVPVAIITPVWIYAAVMLACGAMVIPPFIATVASTKPLPRPALVTAAMLVPVAITIGLAYFAPAYTYAQPQRRLARVFVEPDAATATYEVASHEPGIDLEAGAPQGWYRAIDAPPVSVPFGRYLHPYVFRTNAPSPGPPPGSLTEFSLKPVAAGTELTMTIVPSAPGLSAIFVLPEGIVPSRSNLPGIVARGNRWRAVYAGVPAEGVTWRASFKAGLENKLPAARGVILSSRFPGGSGWQSLPAWLPQQNTVWRLEAAWILAPH